MNSGIRRGDKTGCWFLQSVSNSTADHCDDMGANMEVDFEMRMRDELFRGRLVVAAVCACILGAILLNTPGVDQRQSISAFLLAGGLLFIGFAARRK